jgi:hypothetical protein
MPLAELRVARTAVTDLGPLAGLPLRDLECDVGPERDTAILRGIQTLQRINGKPAALFWKNLEVKKP